MRDQPFTAPGQRPVPRLHRTHDPYLIELRDHGSYDSEARFWQNEECRYSQRFDTRALAVRWAKKERKAIEGKRRT